MRRAPLPSILLATALVLAVACSSSGSDRSRARATSPTTVSEQTRINRYCIGASAVQSRLESFTAATDLAAARQALTALLIPFNQVRDNAPAAQRVDLEALTAVFDDLKGQLDQARGNVSADLLLQTTRPTLDRLQAPFERITRYTLATCPSLAPSTGPPSFSPTTGAQPGISYPTSS